MDNDDDKDKKILNYTYDKVENNITLSLNVYFENPSAITKDITEADILDIVVKEHEIFVSADSQEQLLERDSSFFLLLLP